MNLIKNIKSNLVSAFEGSRYILLLPIFLILSFYPFVADPFTLIRSLFLSIVVFVYFLFSKSEKQIRLDYYSLSFFVLAILSLLSSFWAVNMAESFIGTIFYLLIALLIVFFRQVFKFDRNRIALIKGLLFSSFFIITFVAYQLIFIDEINFRNVESFVFMSSPLGHKNITSGGLLLLLPFSLIAFFRFSKIYKVLSVLSIISSVVIIIILQTRSVYLALFTMSFALGLAFFLFVFRSRTASNQKMILILLCLSFALFVMFINLNPLKLAVIDILKGRITSIFSINEKFSDSNKTIHERLFLWKGTFQIIKDHFWFGIGAGNWKLLFPFEGLVYSRAEQGQTIFQRPHNDFLWVFSELGFFGFLVYVSIFVKALFSLFRDVLKVSILKENKLQKLIVLSGIIAYLIFANFSFPKERIFLVFIMVVYLSLVQLGDKAIVSISKVPFLIINFVVILGLLLSFNSHKTIYKIKKNANNEEWKELLKNADKAVSIFNNLDYTATPVLYYKGVALSNLGKNKEAQVSFFEGLKHNPSHLQSINALGKTYQNEEDLEQAFKIFDSALLISPLFYEAILNISTVSFQVHNYERCFHYLARLNPDQIVLDERYYNKLESILIAIVNDLRKDNLISANAHDLYVQDFNYLMKTFIKSGKEYEKYKVLLVAKSNKLN